MAVSVMLKPASSLCNLKCKYCFYSSLAKDRQEYSKGFMTVETALNTVKSAFSLAKGTPVIFTFQGGEPSLRGLDFYKEFVQICQKENSQNSSISFCFQSNGTLLDDDWCIFFKENNFLVGISLDGNEMQNQYRVYPDGRASFSDVMNTVSLLKKHNVRFNILSVVTKNLALSGREHFRFMKQNDISDFQYINCLKPLDKHADDDLYMNENDYAEFLEKTFKLYYNSNMRGSRISVRSFDNYLMLLSGGNAEQCSMNGFCSPQFVVEGDGTVYPCDFFCTDKFELGNINDKSFLEMSRGETFKKFLKSGTAVDEKCKGCDYFALCRGGGCKRQELDGDFCSVYKKFFSSSIDRMKNMIGR